MWSSPSSDIDRKNKYNYVATRLEEMINGFPNLSGINYSKFNSKEEDIDINKLPEDNNAENVEDINKPNDNAENAEIDINTAVINSSKPIKEKKLSNKQSFDIIPVSQSNLLSYISLLSGIELSFIKETVSKNISIVNQIDDFLSDIKNYELFSPEQIFQIFLNDPHLYFKISSTINEFGEYFKDHLKFNLFFNQISMKIKLLHKIKQIGLCDITFDFNQIDNLISSFTVKNHSNEFINNNKSIIDYNLTNAFCCYSNHITELIFYFAEFMYYSKIDSKNMIICIEKVQDKPNLDNLNCFDIKDMDVTQRKAISIFDNLFFLSSLTISQAENQKEEVLLKFGVYVAAIEDVFNNVEDIETFSLQCVNSQTVYKVNIIYMVFNKEL